MKTFREHLSEEVMPTALVKDGSIDVRNEAVRNQINAILSQVTGRLCVTPYGILNKIRKALAYFHIDLPRKSYMEGRHGVEVYEVHQFGPKMGMNDQGEFIKEVPCEYYVFVHYHLMGSMYMVRARLVDKKELDKEMDTAEAMIAEDAATMQAHSKMIAPKEKQHTALGDCDCSQGDSPSTKKAVEVSMRRKDKKLSADKLDELWEPITGSRRLAGSNRRKRKAVQMSLGRKHKGEEGWNDKTNLQHSALKMGRKLQKQGVVKEEALDEKLTKGMKVSDVISDFVHSDDPKFKGKSKKERMKMALGAYYGMHPEKSRKE